jgi:hypothetical protein
MKTASVPHMAKSVQKTQTTRPVTAASGAVANPTVNRYTAPVRRGPSIPKAVGSFVARLTQPAFEKYGFSAATLLTDWATIVGADLARYTQPERLKWPKAVATYGAVAEDEQGRPGAILMLRVDGGRALDVQYKGRQIIERINAYFGYRAVAELRIIQAPITPLASERPRHEPKPLPRDVIATGPVAAISDEGLRTALARMSAGLADRATSRRGG